MEITMYLYLLPPGLCPLLQAKILKKSKRSNNIFLSFISAHILFGFSFFSFVYQALSHFTRKLLLQEVFRPFDIDPSVFDRALRCHKSESSYNKEHFLTLRSSLFKRARGERRANGLFCITMSHQLQ